jgi:Bacterial Ig-like domain (group 2)
VTSVVVTPTTASLAVNGKQQLQANANLSDRTAKDVTSVASWNSSDSNIASVSKSGMVTAVAPGKATVTASDEGQSASVTVTVAAQQKTVASIALSPQSATMVAGNTRQIHATVTYSDNSTSDVTSSASWTSSPAAVLTVSHGLVNAVAQGTGTVTASVGSVSATASITINAAKPPSGNANVTTFHYDNKRTGLNDNESILTPTNVNPASFGKLFSLTVDGYVYAQPLYMSGLTVNGSTHNVVFVSTEKNIVYAFDADNYNNGTPLWQTTLLNAGESPASGGNPSPYRGSTSTPVIDLTTKTMYVVTLQNGAFRLNAIDVTTGNILKQAPVTAQVSPAQSTAAKNGVLTLSAGCVQRTALLLDAGTLYFGFSSCGSGWLLSYDEPTLAPKGVFAVAPNNDGNGEFLGAGGIWMGGDGPVSDGAGGIYVTTGNGPYNPASHAYGDSVLHFDSSLNLKDWFTPEDYAFMQCQDQDLSGGGVIMLPNGNLVAGGKSGKVYQLDSGNLGQGAHTGNTAAITTLYPGDNLGLSSYPFSCTSSDTTNPPNGQPYPTGTWDGRKTPYQMFGTPAYFNGSVYVGLTPGPIVELAIDNSGKLSLTHNAATETVSTGSLGTTPVISANNGSNAVLWMIDHGTPLQSGTPTPAILRAYNPSDLSKELYDSSKTAGDDAGFGVKFSAPVVANGKVFIATGNDTRLANDSKGEIDVYGLR